ncbi:MAG: type II secretion system protein N [Gammaproteobacteria bacterium]|nr:type II secretion system protein N [Gammaproteobacteria bacterium]
MKQRSYIIIAVLGYVFFTLANIPAATVISLVEKNMQLPAKLYGIQGSLWNGYADSLIIQGQPRIDNLQWSINPLALLLAQVSTDIEASLQEQKITGHLSINTGAEISVSNLRAQLAAEKVQQLINMPLGELAGVFNLDIQSLEWTGRDLPITTASIQWQKARLTLAETVQLGNVEIKIAPNENKGLNASIKNKGGMISLSGTASLQDNKSYKLDLQFTPEDSASENIKQSLGMFAKRQSNGSYRFAKNGNLRQLGF